MQMKEVDKEFLNKVIPELEFWNTDLMWAFWKSEAWVHVEKTAKTAEGQRESHFQVGRLHLFEGIKRGEATAPAQMAFLGDYQLGCLYL